MKPSKHFKGIKFGLCKSTVNLGVIPLPLPETVYIPMSMHAGKPCAPLVKPKDKVKVGQLIGDSNAIFSAPIHSSVSGTVRSVGDGVYKDGNIGTCIVIDSDGRQSVAETVKPPVITSREDFMSAIRASGVAGMGGGGTPIMVKLGREKVDDLVINCAECEAYATSDCSAMLYNSDVILKGIKSCMHWLSISRCIIVVSKEYPKVISLYRELLKDEKNITLYELNVPYPSGSERLLCEMLFGVEVPADRIPADIGYAVCNANSMLKLSEYLETGMPLVSRCVTVDGNAVANPRNIEAPLGTPVEELLDFCGLSDTPGKIIIGGPMLGYAIGDAQRPVIKTTGCIICADRLYAESFKEQACINCGKCHESCPMNLMPAVLSRAWFRRDLERLEDFNVLSCIECGICSFVCPSRRPLSARIAQAKAARIAYERNLRKGGEK